MVERGIADSRHRSKALIMAGNILVDDHPIDKPGTRISPDAAVILRGEPLRFVSRGGLKIEAALKTFKVDVGGNVCLDVGASTGGFTDCLLQNGAAHVFAVDVGYGQLAWQLRQNQRVTVLERTNIRYLSPETIDQPIDLITIDVSFISLKLVVPTVLQFLKEGGMILALIKPQFEVGKGQVGKGGVVRSPALHDAVIDDLTEFFKELGLNRQGLIPSPVLGPKGNREFIIYLLPDDPS